MSSSAQRGTESAGQEDGKPSEEARRAAHLHTAIQLRDMAEKAQSIEARRSLTQLAVLYEELAEYLVTAASRTAVNEKPREQSPEAPADAPISAEREPH